MENSYFYLRLYTSKNIKDIFNKGTLRAFLRDNDIWIRTEEFGARPVMTLEIFTHLYQCLTHCECCVCSTREFVQTLEANEEEKELWIKENYDRLDGNDYEEEKPFPCLPSTAQSVVPRRTGES